MPGWQHLLPRWHRCLVPRRPHELAEPAGNEPSLPLPAAAPLCCLHQNQHVFKSISIFNENFCVYDFFGLGALVFCPPSLFGFPWDWHWLCVPVSLDRAGCVAPSQLQRRHHGRIPAAPASPAASPAARPCACPVDPHRSRLACSIKHRKRSSPSSGMAAKAWQAGSRQAAGRQGTWRGGTPVSDGHFSIAGRKGAAWKTQQV